MAKIVINVCFGGFSLSPKAVKRIAELKGRPCYFFEREGATYTYRPLTKMPDNGYSWLAFDIPDITGLIATSSEAYRKQSNEERMEVNRRYIEHDLSSRPDDRADPDLVRAVEELGEEANGSCADLAVVEVPDGVAWEIEDYDGNEHVAEVHRTWR